MPLESYLRRIIEQQPACLTRIDAHGTFLAVNDAALSLFGATALDEVLGKTLLSLVVAEQRDECRAFVERVAAGGRGSIELDIEPLTGAPHAVQVNAVSMTGSPDGVPSVFCTLRDITKHRRLEAALVEAVAREEAEAAALREAQDRFDATAAEQAHRLAEAEVRLASAEARLQEQQARLIEAEARIQDEHARLGDVEARLLDTEARLRDAETREQAIGLEALDEKERLQAILSRAQLEHEEQVADLKRSAQELQQALSEVGRIVTTVLHASPPPVPVRKELQRPHATDAAAVIRPLSESLEALLRPDIRFRVLIAASKAHVHLSPDQLEALVTMLATNQRTMMVAGGEVWLELADVHIDESCATERGTSPGGYLLLALHATGPGVDAKLPETLFNRAADPTTWRTAGSGALAALDLIRGAGGHGWATREGPDAISLELYIPRADPVMTEVTA